jgi:hypothetical membrane protein
VEFFEKINGAYFAILSVLALAVCMMISLAFYLPFNPSFSIFTYYPCDLTAGPTGAVIALSTGFILCSIFWFFLTLYIARDLKAQEVNNKMATLFLITGIMAQACFIIIGIFPLDPAISLAYQIHKITSSFLFSFMAINFILIGYLEYKNAEYSNLLAIIGIITGLLSAMFTIGFLIVENTPIARNSVVYLSVWTATTFFMFWLIGKGLYFWKKRK